MNVEKNIEQKSERPALESLERDVDLPGNQSPPEITSEMKGTHTLSGKRGIKRKGPVFPTFPRFEEFLLGRAAKASTFFHLLLL